MGWTHFILFGLCGAILCADGASARGVRLQGRATDAATSEPLALATVQVIGTFTGTIANDEGFFVLEVPDGVTANRRLELTGEVAGSALGSDVTFSTWRLAWDWQQPTFWRRRWLPNTLDVRFLAGTSTGDVPPQRHVALDVAMGPLSPFGAFRSIHGHSYEGPRYMAWHEGTTSTLRSTKPSIATQHDTIR